MTRKSGSPYSLSFFSLILKIALAMMQVMVYDYRNSLHNYTHSEKKGDINMSEQQIMNQAEQVLYKTYNRFPVVFDHGKGMHLYDVEGREYLDFGAGISVVGLGYGNEELNEAMKAQIDKLMHTSNLFYSEPSVKAGEKLLEISGMEKVFFTNSGTEAIEGAMKIAMRYAFNKTGKNNREIIAFKSSFHGRSLGSLSVTGNDHYQEPFRPLIPGIKFADFNDLDSVKALINENTCAILTETVQAEGGIYPPTKEFLEGLRALCDEHDMLLIFDEVQCGMGRCGEFFAWQHFGVKPDVMCVAKGIGNGVPVGAFLACGKAATSMVPGDHGTTYGGNPFVCAAVAKVVEMYQERHIPEHVAEAGTYLREQLLALKDRTSCICDVRGLGFLQGIELTIPVGDVVKKALMDEHLVLISASHNVIRFVPPLIADAADIDEMIVRLEKALKACGG